MIGGSRASAAAGFEHDDGSFFGCDVARHAGSPENARDGVERVPFGLGQSLLCQEIADIELQLRKRVWRLQRNQAATIANGYELHARQAAQGARVRDDDDRTMAVGGDLRGCLRAPVSVLPRRSTSFTIARPRSLSAAFKVARMSSGSVTVTARAGRPYFLGRPRPCVASRGTERMRPRF